MPHPEPTRADQLQAVISRSLALILKFGDVPQTADINEAEHKQWILDQVVRALAGEKYIEWVNAFDEKDSDYPEPSDPWSEGIAPDYD